MSKSKIDKANVEDILSLTSMQEGMLFHYLSDPDSKQYFEQIRLRLSAEIKFAWFKEAWQLVCRTNEMLRAVFRWEKLDEPVQIILKDKEIPIRLFDFSTENKEEQPMLLDKIIKEDRNEKIDLTREPLRITLIMLNGDQGEMLITFHHILYDGWSSSIILAEFLEAYQRLANREKPRMIQKTGYKEFLKWYRSQDKMKLDQFWKNYLAGFDTRTLLPFDKSKLAEIRQVSSHKIEISEKLQDQVAACLKKHNLTLAALIFIAWGILLQKYNNSDDIIFGTTVAGRTPVVKGIENIVGLFINTLPLRFKTDKDHSLLEIFPAVGKHLKERSDFEHSSLTEIKKFTGIGQESNLFDSIVVIDNYPLDRIKPAGPLIIRSYDLFEMTNFDLTLQILPFDAAHPRMEINFHYNTDLFEPGAIGRMASHTVNILREIATAPDRNISGIGMLSEDEVKQILYEFNDPGIEYRVGKTIHGAIEDQAALTPDNNAVQFQDQCLSYQEFNERANRLAHLFKEYGVAEGSRVAMMLPRSIDMIAVVLGILKAGAACIPLDISYPCERNSFIIQDSEARCLLTSTGVNIDPATPPEITQVIYNPEILKKYSRKNPQRSVQPQDLSYIIYTSGSTGNPKGALLHHSGVVNHTYTKIDVLGITHKDTVANNFSINVIASVWQILAPLFAGARLLVYTEEIEWDPYGQFKRVEADGVTIIEVIPPVLKTYLFLLAEGKEKISLAGLRKIALTSEETKPFLVNKFYKHYTHIDLVDCYGQTECCDDVLHYTIPVATDTQKVPIGTPSLNTQVLVLNHHDQLQPVGVVGEICVSGAGVGYGYWKRPELTTEKFVTNPLNPGFTMYRTGDLGRWLPNGQVEYRGRLDHQVKIRGNRVELREIENHLLRYPAVKEAAVVAREDREGEQNLYAFFTADEEITTSAIRQYLSKTLPDYMIPIYFIPMEKLPHTPNGKIDRKVLVKTEIEGSTATGTEYKPPRNDYETRIQHLWKQLLAKKQIGINDNFFDLGGHSLLLIKLKSKLEKTFNLSQEIGIIELFNYPTIAHQARYIEENLDGKEYEYEKREEKDKQALKEELIKGSVPGQDRDIAVIGISLRVPGARNIDEFWQNLATGIESISFFEEVELEGSQVDEFVRGHSRLVPAGGVIGDIEYFDSDFFGFNPREAEIIEPQQRLFLEHAWMALEDAGYGNVGESYAGAVGVYAGVGLNTYLLNNVMAHPEVVNSLGEFQTMIGNDKDFLATRLAYKLNLKGPAITIQSACSTSLAAIHLARQGLVTGDCDMAVAGGVAVHVPEKSGYFYNEGGYLSPDGHCRAFDAQADGTVFSNGIGVVVLKRLSEALEDNDHISALIKGSAINNDGSLKVGYTSPSEIGQAKVIYRALKEAGVSPASIGYIETHGTGTVLGDPVEMAALTRSFQELLDSSSNKKQYCAIGSVKSNIGHLDIAAGVVGFIKTVLCLKHKQIPPSINLVELNPIIDFANTPFYVSRELAAWPTSINGSPRRAGVSSFGIGGTNAHVILEEAPEVARGTNHRLEARVERRLPKTKAGAFQDTPGNHQLIVISARTESALERMKENLVQHLKKNSGTNLENVTYTLKTGRKAFDHRLALVCRDREDALEALETFNPKRILMHTCTPGDKSIVFMFSGVGEHYVNMAYELYHRYPLFREIVDLCCDLLKPLLEKDLREILFIEKLKDKREGIDLRKLLNREEKPLNEEEKVLSQTIYSQTAVFVVEYALARLLMEWGIKPYAMIGYSIGEYVAACLAGVFSLKDALFLVANRARLIHAVPEGAMLAVSLPESELKPILGEGVSVAAVNTPEICIVSGKLSGIESLEKQLQEKKILFKRLKTFQAFHSPMMAAVRKELNKLLRKVTLHPPTIPYMSNVTGTWIAAEQVTTPDYWVTHTVSPIRFSEGISELLKTSCNFFLEIGPGNSLCGFVAQHHGSKDASTLDRFVLASLPKESENASDEAFLLRVIGKLWAAGLEILWESFYKHEQSQRGRVPLPTYPFERQRYWLEPGPQKRQESQTRQVDVRIAKKENIADWFYRPYWKQSMPPLEAAMNLEKEEGWLIFLEDPESALGLQLIEQLRKKNPRQSIIIVRIGQQFEKHNQGDTVVYSVNPGQYEDYLAILEDLQEQGKGFAKIVHLWQWDSSPDFLERGVYSLLYLVKAMGKLSMFDTLELWVVSRGLHRIESGDNCDPRKAAILGPCRVIPQEYPNIVCRSVDFQDNSAGYDDERQLVGNLISELCTSPVDCTIAYRGSNRWVQSFEPIKLEKGPDVPLVLRDRGVYLITGGLGRIGLSIAQYLAQAVQAHLVLTSRSDLARQEDGDPRRMKIKYLEDLGAEVLVVQADTADKEQMRKAVLQAEERFGTIHGVLHAAGIMAENAFKLIADSDKHDCELHFKPKIHGLMVLEEVLRDHELDFCLLTSSLSPILGGLSLYAYSAANSFMDGFAHQQSLVKRKNWLSVNWADWEREAPTSDSCANLVTGSTVFQLNITPEEGQETFKRVLSLSLNGIRIPEIVISSGDLQSRLRQWVLPGADAEPGTGDEQVETQKQRVHKRPRLQSLYEPPGNEAERIVAEIWQDLLGIEMVGVHDNFFELGGHSLIATKLISRLREIFRIDIPLPILFDRPTIREVVDNIVNTWGNPETVAEIAQTYREVYSS